MRTHLSLTVSALLLALVVLCGGCTKPVAVSLFGDSTALAFDKGVHVDDGEGAPQFGPATEPGQGAKPPLKAAGNHVGKRASARNQQNRAVYNIDYTTTSSFEDLSRMLSKEGGGAIGVETPVAVGDNANQSTSGQDASGDSEAGDTDQSGNDTSDGGD